MNTETKQEECNNTSRSVQRLVDQATHSLAADKDLQDLEAVLADLTAKVDELSPEQQDQVNELSRLLAADPDSQATVSSLRQDGRFELEPSDDQMQLRLTVRPALAGGRNVATDDIVAELKQRQITQGVDVEAIRTAVAEAAEGQTVEGQVIVTGSPPQPGRSESVELYARKSTRESPERIDVASLLADSDASPTLICHEGDVILKLIAAQPGKPGYNALGQPIEPPKPERVTIHVGQNVVAEEHRYVAGVSGVVLFDGQRIEVRRMLVVDHDVKANDELIDFDGDLQIRGAVRSGACVQATGDIRVDGGVEAARIESTNGNVELKHGVAGQHEAVIRAAGDITARFTENATLNAAGAIYVGMGSLHSRLIAGKSIHLTRGRGQMVGGSAMAGELVEVKQVGSTSGVATELCVGLSREVMNRLARLDEQNARLTTKRDEAADLANQIQRTVGDPMKLQQRELKAYTTLRRVQLVCDVKIKTLDDQREQIMAESARQTGGRVDIHGTMMPKVLIRIGDAELLTKEQQPRCRVVYKEADQSLDIVALR